MGVKHNDKAFIPLHIGIGGIFDVVKGRGSEGVIEEETGRWNMHNNVTDIGLDMVALTPGYAFGFAYPYNACQVGAGNTAPSNSDVSLVSPIAAVGATDGPDGGGTRTYVSGPPAYWQMVRTYQFGTGVAAGNIAELGIFSSQSDANHLFCRELVRDGSGNPTTITVESDEILIVTYTLRFYLDTDDFSGTITIGDTDYDYTRRLMDVDSIPLIYRAMVQNGDGDAARCNAYNGSMSSINDTPTGSSATILLTFDSYTTGSHNRGVAGTFAVDAANFSPGITVLAVLSYLHQYQFGFDPAIPKVLGQQLSVRFRLSWDRYAP